MSPIYWFLNPLATRTKEEQNTRKLIAHGHPRHTDWPSSFVLCTVRVKKQRRYLIFGRNPISPFSQDRPLSGRRLLILRYPPAVPFSTPLAVPPPFETRRRGEEKCFSPDPPSSPPRPSVRQSLRGRRESNTPCPCPVLPLTPNSQIITSLSRALGKSRHCFKR